MTRIAKIEELSSIIDFYIEILNDIIELDIEIPNFIYKFLKLGLNILKAITKLLETK